MSSELYYLSLTAVFCLLLWLPYIGAGALKFGFLKAKDYVSPPERELSAWIERAHRAHLNLVENLPSFIALVLVVELAHINNHTTAMAVMVFFWSRVVQTLVHWMGVPYLRTLAFFAGWASQLVLFYEILKVA